MLILKLSSTPEYQSSPNGLPRAFTVFHIAPETWRAAQSCTAACMHRPAFTQLDANTCAAVCVAYQEQCPPRRRSQIWSWISQESAVYNWPSRYACSLVLLLLHLLGATQRIITLHFTCAQNLRFQLLACWQSNDRSYSHELISSHQRTLHKQSQATQRYPWLYILFSISELLS